MGLIPKPLIRRRPNGRFEINLHEDDREVLRACLENFRETLTGEDPSLRRLFPVAYLQDEALEKEYQNLTHGDLLESRFIAVETMEQTLGNESVDEAELTAWMQAINAMRLVLGTRLDVGNDYDDVDLASLDEAEAMQYWVYVMLTDLVGFIVAILSNQLPPAEDGPLV